MTSAPDGPALAWSRLSDAERECMDYDSFSDGYAAAVEELRSTVEHWRSFGVKPLVLKALGQIAASIEYGWECDREDHTGERCRARRPLTGPSGAATEAVQGS